MSGAGQEVCADFKIRVFLGRRRRLHIGDGQVVPRRRVRSHAHDGKRDFRQRQVFDGFISAVGEQDDAEIRGQIAAFGKPQQTTAQIGAANRCRRGLARIVDRGVEGQFIERDAGGERFFPLLDNGPGRAARDWR